MKLTTKSRHVFNEPLTQNQEDDGGHSLQFNIPETSDANVYALALSRLLGQSGVCCGLQVSLGSRDLHEKWRKCMGIEPTKDKLVLPPNGFEDRGRHQTCKHFHRHSDCNVPLRGRRLPASGLTPKTGSGSLTHALCLTRAAAVDVSLAMLQRLRRLNEVADGASL